jgi:tRNA-Thr(GGU) m(6)t(6)A37 methyltransferase TsaA
MEFTYRTIGFIHTEFKTQKDTPIQNVFSEAKGTLEVLSEYAQGLKDIEGFSHIYLIYSFDRATDHSLLQKPFLDGSKERGIFATRHFNRPNHIGLSIVKLLGVKDNILEISGVDMLDGTPLLDIKPYVRQFEVEGNVSCGWVDDVNLGSKRVTGFTPDGLKEHDELNKRP